jgi:hypothetical protein
MTFIPEEIPIKYVVARLWPAFVRACDKRGLKPRDYILDCNRYKYRFLAYPWYPSPILSPHS